MSMPLEYQVLAAFALDLLLGDPRWLPHPVRLIGWTAFKIESPIRKLFPSPYLAGIVAWLLIVGGTGAAAWGLVTLSARVHPLAPDIVSALLMYTAFAARDLLNHSNRVLYALRNSDLPEARRRVGMIVGRDTENLDEAGVTRATVESVAESTLDGVTAPLFFAVLAGPAGALAYKAINTLDSMFGHKDERYLRFGWASARFDDAANFIPARLTAPLIACAAALLGYGCGSSLRILARDGRKHESPNAGLSEAAVAGALNVQLGGVNVYAGVRSEGPLIGDPNVPLTPDHISRANALMLGTAVLALVLFVSIRCVLLRVVFTGGAA
ncbi:MAG TPA: adenosylcobinamide-phosphate synthase CbiB [Planctomycetota bacterium]|jgi:adenosylcobinamide-phosphate synthase